VVETDVMTRLHLPLLCAALALSCSKDDGGAGGEGDSGSSGTSGINLTEGGEKFDIAMGEGSGGGNCDADSGCMNRVDLLFVIDNSGSMSEEQLNLALNFPSLVQGLETLTDADGNPLNPDVNIMVTTTDMGNPLCTPFYKPGRMPEMGAPIYTPCTDRLDRFTGIGMDPVVAETACTTVCPNPVAPDDQFINFSLGGTNVPPADPVDVNGDGEPDSNIAQALACIGPQGIDGCGYESQLESMRSALDSSAEHNQGDTPFLRSGGILAVAFITDEVDCSLADESIMNDEAYIEIHPETMMPLQSSAICWNAGVTCDGPDGSGVYSNCASSGEGLVGVQEYIDFLQGQGRPVVMLGIIGVPIVTERNPDPPYQPIAGGVMDLVYRVWQDPEYPTGDVLPDEWAGGTTAAHKEWEFGIGPGCTGEDGMGGFTGQATPPTRIIEVCQALDIADDPATPVDEARIRCCIESICDTTFENALRCLTGLVSENAIPQG
jgi:hypothetical protein